MSGERDVVIVSGVRTPFIKAGTELARVSAVELGRIAELEAAFERVRRAGKLALQRHDLAIDGERVIRILGCKPGPVVGRALRYLTDRVVEDPTCNTPEALSALLEAWAEPGKN